MSFGPNTILDALDFYCDTIAGKSTTINEKYDATCQLNTIIKAIENVRKLGLHVYINDNKLCVANTVACQDRINRGLSCKEDSFAYAEYDKLSDD